MANEGQTQQKHHKRHMRAQRKWSLLNMAIVIISVVLILWVLTGGINQVATGQHIIDWTKQMAEQMGQIWIDLFQNQGPVHVTEDGVYLQGANPPD